jgi:CubicO group peptidase (beta-lactamase class C family)
MLEVPWPETPDAAVATTVALARLARRHRLGRLQFLRSVGGEIVDEHALGVADALRGRPVTARSCFNLYSITKPVTAAAALVMADRGHLDLAAPLAAVCRLPGLARYGTLRDTLLHRAGLPNPLPLRWVHLAAEDAAFDESAFVAARLRALGDDRWAVLRRGRFVYSNLGYLAIGLAMAQAQVGDANRTDARAALRRLVLDRLRWPLGAMLGFDPPAEDTARGLVARPGLLAAALPLLVDRAHLVEASAGSWWQLRPHRVDGSAYGGLLGNARGLAAFAHAVLGPPHVEDQRPAPLPGSVREALMRTAPGPGPARTLAWFEGRTRGWRWLAHAGGGLGGYGELRLYPDLGAVSVLLTNTPGLRDRRWLDAVDAAWLPAARPVTAA